MTHKRGQVTFRRGVDRLFEQIDQFTIQQTMFTIGALWASKTLGHGFNPDDTTVIDSSVFPLSLEVPLNGVAEAAFEERYAQSRSVVIQTATKAGGMPDKMPFSTGFNSVLWLPVAPIFVDFYERVRPWMERNFKNQKVWPPTMFFASFIRNAVSHGGALHITQNSGRIGQWHHLAYRYGDKAQIIGPLGVFSPADLLFLMLDMSDELDSIGCPVI